VAPILFKHDTFDGKLVQSESQLQQAGYEVYVPVTFEP
jgi:hypothetical protein